MQIRFTKMQGAGNDFVVLDETRGRLGLTAAHYRFLGDRHFGVGADQILTVRPSPAEGIDFEYIIHNADGAEVEQCGNGSRCFARFVRDKGLTTKDVLRVKTQKGVISPELTADGRVTVDMGAPVFALADIPFDPRGTQPMAVGSWQKWPLALSGIVQAAPHLIATVSMGNPHAVLRVTDINNAPVHELGPKIEHHPRFPARVNVGFLQVIDRNRAQLRVWERGAGETQACGTGACAAAVAAISQGWMDSPLLIDLPGGRLSIEWAGPGHPVMMTGPATRVYEGQVRL